MLEEIMDMIESQNIKRPLNLLEIGPGLSVTSREIARKLNVKEITILDWNEEVLKIQKEQLAETGAKIITRKLDMSDLGKLSSIKLPPQDLIVCTEVLEHVADEKKAVEFIHSHLKEDGLAVLSVPSKRSEKVFHFVNRDYMVDNTGHVREFDEKTIKGLMASKSMKIVKFKKVCSDFFIGNLLLFIFKVPIDENTGQVLAPDSFGAKMSDFVFRLYRKLRLTQIFNHVINRNFLLLARKNNEKA